MKARLTAIWLLFCVFAPVASADTMTCAICGQPINGSFYNLEDRLTGEKKFVCAGCEALEGRCFVCGLPMREGFVKLNDGRYLCARDSTDVVTNDDEAIDVANKVRDDLDRLFSRFLTIPETNVEVSVGDKFQLEAPFRAPGNEDDCVTVYGHTRTSRLSRGTYLHHITLLSYLQKSRFMAVCAHEFGHTWINENVPPQRKAHMNKDTVEGFCELVAYKYMASLDDNQEMKTIRHNNYTKGQIHVLIEADRKYGFDTVMEWMKAGEDDTLDFADLDRIRATGQGYVPTPEAALAALLYVPPHAPSPVPDTLELKGISGTPQHRFALINDTTFQPGERWKVRKGSSKVMVQCLEIRPESAVIRVAGSSEKQELFLPREQ